ncbi:hypothetical protein GJAV_G00062750 [Gymnothorax javanicus]|nr:hypothetical protein GJAV_G00062750 [Gymnothorax javanicus]
MKIKIPRTLGASSRVPISHLHSLENRRRLKTVHGRPERRKTQKGECPQPGATVKALWVCSEARREVLTEEERVCQVGAEPKKCIFNGDKHSETPSKLQSVQRAFSP